MTIQTGITANRKALAAQISQELAGAPVTYAGVPSCAYRVGACVTIGRQGDIEITNADAAAVLKLLRLPKFAVLYRICHLSVTHNYKAGR